MYTGLLHTHRLVVTLFFLIYIIKIVLLLLNKQDTLETFTKKVKVPEMIISTLFLLTGIVMMTQIAEIGNKLIIKVLIVLASIPLAVIGFKKQNKLLAGLSVLLIIGAYGLGEMNKIGVDITPLDSTIITNSQAAGYQQQAHGEAIYLRNCAVCHGEDGKKRASGAKDLTVTKLSDTEIEQLIKGGKNAMPPYKSVLDEVEVSAVAAYIKSLK